MRKVCVIFGGRSGEHEVSVTSAESVVNSLDRSKYSVRTMAITRTGKWIGEITPAEYRAKFLDGSRRLDADARASLPSELLDTETRFEDREIVFPVLHGPFGEDGTIQGLLEMLDVPYVGSGVLGSAVAMDKALTKYVCLAYGIPVVEFEDITRFMWKDNHEPITEFLSKKVGFPCFVKPANLGSSIGITKVPDAESLADAMEEAFLYDMKVIVERAVECREIECSVLGNYHPEASIAGEIVPCNEFYDYNAKYLDDRSELIIPAKLDVEQVEQLQQLAVTAFVALNCFGMARADFFLDKETDEFFLNELNTIPGFTSISMYPKLWEASGLPYPELLDQLVQLAIERFENKQRIHGNVMRTGAAEEK